jgi:hypothetical protein
MRSLVDSFCSLVGWGLGIAISLACLRNVFWQSTEQERSAAAIACGERRSCSAQLRRFMATPLGRTYAFVTPTGNVEVRCTREFILAGDYACALENSEPVPSASAAASTPAPAPASTPASALKPAVNGKPRR